MDALLAIFFEKVFTEASLVAIVFAVLWWLERSERHRILKDLTNQISKLAVVLEILKDRSER